MAQDPMLAMAQEAQLRAREARREEIVSNSPSASYMLARIEIMTKALIQRFADILDVAITPEPLTDTGDTAPSLVDTANKQLIIDTATMSMIRAAEELMVLTRTMKELWLLGDLDTLVADQSQEEKQRREQMQRDEDTVVRGLQEWLRKNGDSLNRSITKTGDVAMPDN